MIQSETVILENLLPNCIRLQKPNSVAGRLIAHKKKYSAIFLSLSKVSIM